MSGCLDMVICRYAAEGVNRLFGTARHASAVPKRKSKAARIAAASKPQPRKTHAGSVTKRSQPKTRKALQRPIDCPMNDDIASHDLFA